MTFTKFVQIGRVAHVAFGPDKGKLLVIVDLIDHNRVLVDGPGIRRQALNVKSLYLTKFLIKIPHSARQSTVKKAWEKAEIEKKWAETKWAKKLASATLRANLTDFDRHKLMRAKQARNRLITLETGKLRLAARKSNAGKAAATKKPAAAAAKKTAAKK